MRCPSVSVSVCPSVTFVHSVKTSIHNPQTFVNIGQPNHCSFACQTLWRYYDCDRFDERVNLQLFYQQVYRRRYESRRSPKLKVH